MGQGRVQHVDRSEDIDVELGPQVLVVQFLQRAGQCVAGVVDDHIEPAEDRDCVVDGARTCPGSVMSVAAASSWPR
ncbi:hypothetical protein BJF90_15815 [Pseudonocardia sp. CNS-004]|nr:hypothetical protein BJF90_15815 [Pseudonocardia sp. CNS-004]